MNDFDSIDSLIFAKVSVVCYTKWICTNLSQLVITPGKLKVRTKSTNMSSDHYHTLIVSSASSITAHCLGVRALASSRPMCSCRIDKQIKPSVYTPKTVKILIMVTFHYIFFVPFCFITLSLESWPNSLAALKIIWVPCQAEKDRRVSTVQ